MTTGSDSKQIRRRKFGTFLMLFFMVAWIVSQIGMQMYIGVQRGYGTGFGDGGRVPPDIVAKVGVGSRAADVVAATSNHNVPEMSVAEDVGRIVLSFGILLAIIFFWYSVMSRVGTF